MNVKCLTYSRYSTSIPIYTINQERFGSLDGAALERLNKGGYLQLAVMVLHSLGNMQWIIELKNHKRAAGAA